MPTMAKAFSGIVAGTIAVLGFVVAPAVADAPRRPNIVFINAEDISPHLGCYGDAQANTPVIDGLARQGIVYRQAFATAPICSPSRSCLATGLYATSLGTQHLRCEVRIPDAVQPLAVRLRELGYFCTNTGKTDYNFDPTGIWDAHNQELAPWRARAEGQPFYAFITIGQTHEGPTNNADRLREATAGLSDDQRADPAKMQIPPFLPDTPEMRRIVAGLYDQITVFDQRVGAIVEALREDGDWDNTVVLIFSDHGNGLPRYKRWLNDTGLRVPLVVWVPEAWRHLAPHEPGSQTDRLVSFVDFPATALSLADHPTPSILEGTAFLGSRIGPERRYVFGARDRADDMFEMSRSVFDGRYLYVRHFKPHLPAIQRSVIVGDQKRSFRELRRTREAGELNEHAERLFADRKPRDELYDLQADPHELVNLADDPAHAPRRKALAQELQNWMRSTHDTGLLTEADYQLRAQQADSTPMDVVRDPGAFDLEATLQAAWRVGEPDLVIERAIRDLGHSEAGVRYWSVVALDAAALKEAAVIEALEQVAQRDESPAVRIQAAEALAARGASEVGVQVLAELVQDERPWIALQAASGLTRAGAEAQSAVPTMQATIQRLKSPPGSRRVYKDFNYASFTGWALEAALEACGHPVARDGWP